MNDNVTLKKLWDLSVNSIKKLRIILSLAFHTRHPENTFIMVQALGPCTVKLFEGSRIRELAACGLTLEPLCLGLDACRLRLEELGA